MKIKLIFLFVLFYLAALLITLPADKIAQLIPEKTGISVTAASGSLWDGEAAQLTYKQQFQFQQLDWKIDWSALARLQLKVAFKFNNGIRAMSGKGFIALGLSGVSVEDLVVDISAAELFSYARLPVPLKVAGDFSIALKNASQGQPYCQQLDGDIIWRNAQINSDMGNVDLEAAKIKLSCDKGQVVADLHQHSAQLTATARFLLKNGGVYQLKGLLKAGNMLDPSLKEALSWMGRKNQSGETIVSYSGRL